MACRHNFTEQFCTSILIKEMSWHIHVVINEPRHEKTNNFICKNKDADQLCGYRKADHRLCFHYTDRTISLLPNFIPLLPNFEASSYLLWLYSPVCVWPDRKPECWFSHIPAQMYFCREFKLWVLIRIQNIHFERKTKVFRYSVLIL